MPGIRYEDRQRERRAGPFLREIEIELAKSVRVEDTKAGYLAIGGRNIVACQGTAFARKPALTRDGLSRREKRAISPLSSQNGHRWLPGARCARRH